MADSSEAVNLERDKIIRQLQLEFDSPTATWHYEQVFVLSDTAPESSVLQTLIRVHLLDSSRANEKWTSDQPWSDFMNKMPVLQALVALVNDIRQNKVELLVKKNPEDKDFKDCVFRMNRLIFLLDPRFQSLAQSLVAEPLTFVMEDADDGEVVKNIADALNELNAYIKQNGDIGSPLYDGQGSIKFDKLNHFTDIKIKARNTVVGAIRQLLSMRLPELRAKADHMSKFYKYIRILNRIEILMHNIQSEIPIISWNGSRYSCSQGDGQLRNMNCEEVGGGSAQLLNVKNPSNAAFVLNPVDYSRPSGSAGPGDADYGTGTITCSLKPKSGDGSIKPWTCHPEADEFAAVSYLRTHSFDFYKATTYHLKGRKPRALYFRSNPLTTIGFDKRRLENLILSVYQNAGDTLSKEVRSDGKEATYNVKEAIYPSVDNRAWKCLVHMTGCLNHQEFVYVHNTSITVNTSHTPMCTMTELVNDKPDLAALDLVFKKPYADGVQSDPTNLGTQFIIIPFGFFVQHNDSKQNYGHSVSLVIYKKKQLFFHDPNGPNMSKKSGLKGYSSPQCIQELVYNSVVDFLHRNCNEMRAKKAFSLEAFPFSRDIFWCNENIHGEFGDLVAARGGVCEAVNSWQMSILVCNPWMDRDLFQQYIHDRRHQWTASIFPHSSAAEKTAAFHVVEKLLGIFNVNEDIIKGGDLDIQEKAAIGFVSLEHAAKILGSAMTRLSLNKKDALMRLLESPNYTSKQLSMLKDEKAIDDALKDGIMDANRIMPFEKYGDLLTNLRFEDLGEYETLAHIMELYAVQIYGGGEHGDPDVESSAVKSYLMNNMTEHMEALRSWYQIMAVFEADISKEVLSFSDLFRGLTELHYKDGTYEEKEKKKRDLFFEHEHICGSWTEVQIFMWMQYIEELHTRMFEFPVPMFLASSVPITSAKTVSMIEANAPTTTMAFTFMNGKQQLKGYQEEPKYMSSHYIEFEDSTTNSDGTGSVECQRAFVWSASLGPIAVEAKVYGSKEEAETSHPTANLVQTTPDSKMFKSLFDHAANGTEPPAYFTDQTGSINEESPTIVFMQGNTKAIVARKKKTDWRCNTILGVSSVNSASKTDASTDWPRTLSNPVNVMSPFGAIPPPYNIPALGRRNAGWASSSVTMPQEALIQMAPPPSIYDQNKGGKKVDGSLYNNSVDCLFKTKRAFK